MIVVVFKQKTAYEMRISDWRSDVCSSYLISRFSQNLWPECVDQIAVILLARPPSTIDAISEIEAAVAIGPRTLASEGRRPGAERHKVIRDIDAGAVKHAPDTILSLLPRIIADELGNLIARHRCKNQSERHDSDQRADRFCKGVTAYEQQKEKQKEDDTTI